MAHRQKPATAAWIQRERKRLGLSTRELSERLALIGAKAGEQTISVWESYADRKPSADNLDALSRIFGSEPPERPQTPESQTEVAAAIREQTAVLIEVLAELRLERAQRDVSLEQMAELLGGLARMLGFRLPEGTPIEDEPGDAVEPPARAAQPQRA